MIRGIDISVYQQRVDWPQVAKAGVRFVYVRATYGGHNDAMCAKHVRGARAVGLDVGLYHFFKPGTDHLLQSSLFLGMHSTLKEDITLSPALDVETKDGKGNAFVVSSVRAMFDDMKSLYPGMLLYTFPYFMTDPKTGRPAWPADFKDKRLWVSHYGVQKPIIPAPWDWYTIWQNMGNDGRVSGVVGPCDTDVIGSEEQLQALRLVQPCGPQRPAGIVMSPTVDTSVAPSYVANTR